MTRITAPAIAVSLLLFALAVSPGAAHAVILPGSSGFLTDPTNNMTTGPTSHISVAVWNQAQASPFVAAVPVVTHDAVLTLLNDPLASAGFTAASIPLPTRFLGTDDRIVGIGGPDTPGSHAFFDLFSPSNAVAAPPQPVHVQLDLAFFYPPGPIFPGATPGSEIIPGNPVRTFDGSSFDVTVGLEFPDGTVETHMLHGDLLASQLFEITNVSLGAGSVGIDVELSPLIQLTADTGNTIPGNTDLLRLTLDGSTASVVPEPLTAGLTLMSLATLAGSLTRRRR